jgi:predicted dienelactone hydrolase
MTTADILLIAAILVFLSAWWTRSLPARGKVLLASCFVALTAAAWGVWDNRWQAGVGVFASLVFLTALAIGRLRNAERASIRYVTGSLLTLLGASAIAVIYLFPVWPLPAPSGKYAVGVRTFELDDASRPGVFHAAPGEPRRLLVRVWYPAEPERGATPRRYFSDPETRTTARSMGQQLGFAPLLTYIKHVRTNAFEDAPLVAGAKDLPTIFYSHGYGSFLAQNSVLLEDLASHGYVVYSVQHTYDSSATVFPDGDVAPIDPALIEELENSPEAKGEFPKAMVAGATGATFDERLEGQIQYTTEMLDKGKRISKLSALTWAADQMFVHDRLQSGEVPKSVAEIAAACDLARTGEMGMSFGGATAGVICLLDKRCVAGINLDGGDFPFLPFNVDLPVPFLMLHSDFGGLYKAFGVTAKGDPRSFNDFSYERFENAGSGGQLYRAQVKDSAHLGLSDFTLFMRQPLRDGLLGSTPTDVMIGVQNDLVRGFFDKHLRGVANDFPQAEYQKYAEWVIPYNNPGLRDWWLAKTDEERAKITNRIDELKTKMEWHKLRRETPAE